MEDPATRNPAVVSNPSASSNVNEKDDMAVGCRAYRHGDLSTSVGWGREDAVISREVGSPL